MLAHLRGVREAHSRGHLTRGPTSFAPSYPRKASSRTIRTKPSPSYLALAQAEFVESDCCKGTKFGAKYPLCASRTDILMPTVPYFEAHGGCAQKECSQDGWNYTMANSSTSDRNSTRKLGTVPITQRNAGCRLQFTSIRTDFQWLGRRRRRSIDNDSDFISPMDTFSRNHKNKIGNLQPSVGAVPVR